MKKSLMCFVALCFVMGATQAFGVDYIWLGTVDNTWSGINWWDGTSQVGPPTTTADGAILNANSPQVVIEAADNAVAGTILTQAGLDLDVFGTVNALRMWNEYTGGLGSSTVNVHSGASMTFSGLAESELFIGKAGTGVMNISSGASVTTDLLRLGFDGGANGTLNMTGGTMTANTNLIAGWGAGSTGSMRLTNDASVFVSNIFFSHGFGNGSFLLEDDSVLDVFTLNTGFDASGNTDIDLWGGDIVVRNVIGGAGPFNIDIRLDGTLTVPIGQKGTLEAFIASGDIVGDGGATTVLVVDDLLEGTTTASIPEPASMLLLGLGSVLFCKRRKS